MSESNHWRQMFDRNPRQNAQDRDVQGRKPTGDTSRSTAYDDGFLPQAESISLSAIADAAAMALAEAEDVAEYRPWILQRGPSRPAMLLHMRRYDAKSGMWIGWQTSYPALTTVDYTGDTLLALDFGTRQFMLEGAGLDELARHLQIASVLMVQEYTPNVWPHAPVGPRITAIRKL